MMTHNVGAMIHPQVTKGLSGPGAAQGRSAGEAARAPKTWGPDRTPQDQDGLRVNPTLHNPDKRLARLSPLPPNLLAFVSLACIS